MGSASEATSGILGPAGTPQTTSPITTNPSHSEPQPSQPSYHASQVSFDASSIYTNYQDDPAVQLVNRLVSDPSPTRQTSVVDEPPPPYTAVPAPGTAINVSVTGPSRPTPLSFENRLRQQQQQQNGHMIRRKPLTPGSSLAAPYGVSFGTFPLPERTPGVSSNMGDPQKIRKVKSAAVISNQSPTFDTLPAPPPLPTSSDDLALTTPSSSSSSSFLPASQPPIWKNVLGEAQFFATGLLSRPVESTRHYSVIRHSYALVWYRGPSTSVSITILSDEPIPPTRRIFLQQKGFSGDTGMVFKAMVGSRDSWLDVTPQQRAEAYQLPPTEERAIQRDLSRLQKKATGRASRHVPKETCIVRIPATAQDGYFRLVLTDEKKKVLAGCPVFRIASTSTDSSVIRGSSIRSMPIELGVKVGSTVANIVVSKYTTPITGVIGATVGSRMQKYGSKVTKMQHMGTKMYETTGMDQHYMEHRQQYDQAYQNRYQMTHTGPGMGSKIQVIGVEMGPVAPFPIKFTGTVVQGSGRARAELDMPTANLKDVPENIKVRMPGVYIAWAKVIPGSPHPDIDDEWHQAVATIAPPGNLPPTVVPKNKVHLHILEDYDTTTFFGAKVEVLLMGYIRPYIIPRGLEEALDVNSKDLLVTMMSLGRPNWAVEEAVETVKQGDGQRTIAERLTELRLKVQDQVDKIPMHLAGVRTEGAGARETGFAMGGIWIVR